MEGKNRSESGRSWLNISIPPPGLLCLASLKVLDSGFLPTLLVKPVFLPLIQVFVFYIVSCQRQITMLVLHVALGNSLARSPAARMQWRRSTGNGNERPSFYHTESSERNSAWEFLPTYSISLLSGTIAVNMWHATDELIVHSFFCLFL